MKNNIKYAGIAAAALLTVAPIATPVVNSATNTQVAQAATTKATDAETDALDNFYSSLKDSVTVGHGAAFPFFDDISASNYGQNIDYKTFSGLQSISALKRTVVNDQDNTTLENSPIKFKVESIKGASPEDLQNFGVTRDGVKNNGGTITLRVTAYDADGTTQLGKQHTYTFTKSTTAEQGVTSLQINYTNPYSVALNDSVTTPKYTGSVDATAVDQNGDAVKVTGINPSGNIYTSKNAAVTNDGKTDLYTSSTFKTDGATYYQPVTITLDSAANVQDIYKSMQGDQGGSILLNGAQAVDANISKDTNNTITYVREIKVGDTTPDNGTWKETASAGKVTVGNSLAHLYNDDNDLTSRSVAANTPWATDKYRTNSKTGQVQYRVSTHEWVNATDVTFSGNDNNGGNTNNGEGLTNVTDLQGTHVVNLAGPEGFVYTLFKLNGGQGNRGLAGLTSWATDKTAQDANGNTYYRVSTDEWVRQGEGVTFN